MLGRRLLNNIVLQKKFVGENLPFVTTTKSKNISFIFLWLNKIFNAVDQERLKLVGPDLSCSEWLLRNGACVRFKGHESLLTDYNELIRLEELAESKDYKVEEIYAKDSAISRVGFKHLKGCCHVTKITLICCNKVDAGCLYELEYVKDSLEYLKIKACFNVTDRGLLSLVQLKNLRTLILANLPSVEDKMECEKTLKSTLTRCQVTFVD